MNSNNHLLRSLADSEDYDDDGDGIPDTEDEVWYSFFFRKKELLYFFFKDHPDFDDENDEL